MTEIITSLEGAAADAVLVPDGDDSLLRHTAGLMVPEHLRVVQSKAAAPKARMIVLFVRELKRGSKGRDVLAVKRALSKAGYIHWGGFTKTFGPYAVKALKRFQKAKGLKVTGVYDKKTHAKLAPSFDAYGVWLLGQNPNQSPEEKVAQAIVNTAIYTYNMRAQIHYSQGSHRMDFVRLKIRPPKVPTETDCSGIATFDYWAAYAPDPNGNHFNGYGYTGTMAGHGVQVRIKSIKDAKPANLALYGRRPNFSHVVVCIGGGKGISHGSEPGPLLVNLDYRGDLAEIRRYPMVA